MVSNCISKSKMTKNGPDVIRTHDLSISEWFISRTLPAKLSYEPTNTSLGKSHLSLISEFGCLFSASKNLVTMNPICLVL